MAADLFVVPTVTFRLFSRSSSSPTTADGSSMWRSPRIRQRWTAPQLRNAFPETGPRYLLHDRDTVFADVATTPAGMHTQAVRTAPRSPWQNAYVERVIGSIRPSASIMRSW